jgi:hypothetical protein
MISAENPGAIISRRDLSSKSIWIICGALDPIPAGKTRITIRIDDDILDWFRNEIDSIGGGNYQTLMNQALREYVLRRQEPLEEILRRVVREELHSMAG